MSVFCPSMTFDKVSGLSVLLSRFFWVFFHLASVLTFSSLSEVTLVFYTVSGRLLWRRTLFCEVLVPLMKLQSFPCLLYLELHMLVCLWSSAAGCYCSCHGDLIYCLNFALRIDPKDLPEVCNHLIKGNQFSLFLNVSLGRNNCIWLKCLMLFF